MDNEDLGATTDELIEGQKSSIKIGERTGIHNYRKQRERGHKKFCMNCRKGVGKCNKILYDRDENPPAVKIFTHRSFQTYGTL